MRSKSIRAWRPESRPRQAWLRLNRPNILWSSFIQTGVVLAPFTFTWSGLVVCLVLYLLVGFGITMGYHRLLTHRSFQTPRVVEYLLAVLGSLANQGGPLQWVAVHRVRLVLNRPRPVVSLISAGRSAVVSIAGFRGSGGSRGSRGSRVPGVPAVPMRRTN